MYLRIKIALHFIVHLFNFSMAFSILVFPLRSLVKYFKRGLPKPSLASQNWLFDQVCNGSSAIINY